MLQSEEQVAEFADGGSLDSYLDTMVADGYSVEKAISVDQAMREG